MQTTLTQMKKVRRDPSSNIPSEFLPHHVGNEIHPGDEKTDYTPEQTPDLLHSTPYASIFTLNELKHMREHAEVENMQCCRGYTKPLRTPSRRLLLDLASQDSYDRAQKSPADILMTREEDPEVQYWDVI